MKTFLLFIVFQLAFHTTLIPQTEKVMVLINGGLSGTLKSDIMNSASGYEDYTERQLFLFPSLGLFIWDNFLIGAESRLLFTKYDADGYSGTSVFRDSQPSEYKKESKEFSYSIGPIARYYFVINNFAPFIQFSTHYGYKSYSITIIRNSINRISEGSIDSKIILFAPAIGFSYFINNNLSIEIVVKNEFIFEDINTKESSDSYLLERTREIKTKRIFIAGGLQVYLPVF
jgi:hypothetical protein